MGYAVDFIPDSPNRKSLTEKSSYGHISSQSGTATLKDSDIHELNLGSMGATVEKRALDVDDDDEKWMHGGKDSEQLRIWKIDQSAIASPTYDNCETLATPPRAVTTESKTLETLPSSKLEHPKSSVRRGPVNPLNSSQKWAGPRARKSTSLRSSDNSEPTLPVIRPGR
jgi:hypothetical protein